MTNKLLKIFQLEASIGTKQIIKNLNLEIEENQIHLIMGPNGSGKSTLSKILTGHPSYLVTNGKIEYCGFNLLEMEIDKRAQEGIFLAFQYPLEISGITNFDFLRAIYNEKQKYNLQKEIDPIEFMSLLQPFLQKLNISSEFLTRNLNEGFSGGEKKRNEILQMLLLNPKLIILDEIDSGLDIDAVKIIFEGILNTLQTFGKICSLLVITHNPKILTYLKPDYVHIMVDGKIVKTGNLDLVDKIENFGYQFFKENK
jgi:Fe-S cluster assembly ATP-binding protein